MKKLFTVLVLAFLFTGFVNAQSNMAIGAGVVVSLPMGTFGDGANTGFGGTAAFEMNFMSQLVGTAQAGYLTWGTDADEVSFSAIPILVGAKYFFVPNLGLYGHGQLGVSLFTFDTPEVTVPFFGTVGGSETSTEFTFAIGAGYEVQASETFVVDISGAFNIISDANHITFRVGGKVAL